ncbi:MAG TPA: cytochrome c [Bacteroidales bacterium]|jgi:mono/diheme cytochrome c family protein
MKTFKLLLLSAVVLFFSASLVAQPKAWVVPANFKSMKNPVATSDASVKAGQALFAKTCAACHGKTGLGDGPKSKSLKTSPTNFTKAESQNQTDGEHFYKTKTGRGDMPKYEGKLSDDDIWNIVNYVRTLKK